MSNNYEAPSAQRAQRADQEPPVRRAKGGGRLDERNFMMRGDVSRTMKVSMIYKLAAWIAANRLVANLVALAIALAIGFASSEVFRLSREQDYQILLNNQVQREAIGMVNQTLKGKPMGAVALAGQYDPDIRETANRKDAAPNDHLAVGLEILARAVDGDGAFVVNGNGVITASWDIKGRTRNGNVVKQRPYYQMAMEGMESVYAAVGSSTGDRALYIAAPVFTDPGQGSTVIGAVVGRIDVRNIDQALIDWDGIALLLSPQGVVFASSRPDWLFQLAGPVDDARIKSIASLGQFGKALQPESHPKSLPFPLDEDIVAIEGKRYAAASSKLAVNDPNGDWSVVLLGDLARLTPMSQRLSVGGFMGAGFFVLCLVALRALKESLARRAAVIETELAAERLRRDADIKSRRGEFVAALQQARTTDDLAQSFFSGLARILPVQQGTLYCVNADGSLKLAGAYGAADAPPVIAAGMGLAGQCALERRAMSFSAPPEGFWRVRTGLGDAAPRSLQILPVIRSQELLGIVELASRSVDFAEDHAMLDELLPVLAVNLEILMATQRTEQALAEARDQAADFSAQQEISKEVEDWFHIIINGAPDAILVVESGGNIVLANEVAAKLFGYPRSDLEWMTIDTLLPDQFREIQRQLWAQPTVEAEIPVRAGAVDDGAIALTADGHEVPVTVSLSGLPELGFRGSCVCAIIRHA